MSTAVHNPLNAPVFEIPEPPDEFGQDGGKFYRCYDALAAEIDEDMTQGLKEQLDGMLIFAGLFAGVNSAFLALTIPLLSADPADDTNALLAQNSAILMQLLMGRNDTQSTNPILPSVGFSPSRHIFTINALSSLSLAFAIISSFLAVLGRQWLIYYRKRGGGGPGRQRWAQLKRFLGADHERWGLELILDDVLPSLLQIGLIIFCASLVLYLHHLSPMISLIVGIPMSIGLAFFIGSAFCSIWDRFCPFHSPLSHLVLWAGSSLSWIWAIVKESPCFIKSYIKQDWRWMEIYRGRVQEFGQRVRGVPSAWYYTLRNSREEESLESFQAIALRRTICISDDPVTLLYAIANIVTIGNPAILGQLQRDPIFQQRFFEVIRTPGTRMSHLRGHNMDLKHVAISVRRLSCSAIGHIILTTNDGWEYLSVPNLEIPNFSAATILIPDVLLPDSSPNSIKASLGFCLVYTTYFGPSDEQRESIRSHITACSDALAASSNLSLLSACSWIVSCLPNYRFDILIDISGLHGAYRG
ncbi:hypothetical protein FRC01_000311, partial [Tulasnella sp. 417]